MQTISFLALNLVGSDHYNNDQNVCHYLPASHYFPLCRGDTLMKYTSTVISIIHHTYQIPAYTYVSNRQIDMLKTLLRKTELKIR